MTLAKLFAVPFRVVTVAVSRMNGRESLFSFRYRAFGGDACDTL